MPKRTCDDLLAAPPQLPVAQALPQLRTLAASPGRALVISAPPGCGKTTLLPPLLASQYPDATIIVTQPRRVAARAAARRLASLLGEAVGQTVGYSVRSDTRKSPGTRIEFVTPGVLLRRMNHDCELSGVAAVVLDEFHERQIETDLLLAFLIEARQALRDDLTICVTSATLDIERIGRFLADSLGADQVAQVDAPGVTYPLDIRWAPPPRGVCALAPLGGDGRIGVTPAFIRHIAAQAAQAYYVASGDVLVFVPGVHEIRAVIDILREQVPTANIMPLHGQLSSAQQDAVLTPTHTAPTGQQPHSPTGQAEAPTDQPHSPTHQPHHFPDPPARREKRRIIVSTALAESALTVPGVRCVVDAGLSREARLDWGRGATQLVTVPATRSQMSQRAGRAAREGTGIVVRCIDQADWVRRAEYTTPEIHTVDLTDSALQAAAWGSTLMNLPLLDLPPSGAYQASHTHLRALGAVNESGTITSLGRRLAELPLSPHWGRALLALSPTIGGRRAAQMVAFLSEFEHFQCDDVALAWHRWCRTSRTNDAITTQARRLHAFVSEEVANTPLHDDDALALCAAFSRPQWIARRRGSTRRYLLADGQGATLRPASSLEGHEWLAIVELQGVAGADNTITAALPIAESDALLSAQSMRCTRQEVSADADVVQAWNIDSLGAIELARRPLSPVPTEAVAEALHRLVETRGVTLLTWSKEAYTLRHRMGAVFQTCGPPWPDVSDEVLCDALKEWATSHADEIAHRRRLGTWDAIDFLRALLPWPEAAHLDALAPNRIEIPTGDYRNLDWSQGTPILTLRVQEAFGWVETPRFIGGQLPLVLHLTDPAGRVTAVTSDLASFWAGPYQQVRAQLRGRYPKHPWPQDPLSAAPTSRAKPRSGATQ